MSDKECNSQNIFEADEDVLSVLSNGNASIHDNDDRIFEMSGSSMLLHQLLESVNPTSLIELLASVTNAKLEISLESKKTTVIMTTECGEVVFSNKDKFATWDCIESEESLLIEVAYRFSLPMYLAPKIQANLNRELLFGRVIVDENENVEFRTTINFKGGRSVENVLWNILDFNKEVLAIKNSLFK